MHSKTKGGLGVSKVCSYFLERDIPCFVEAFCDLSASDIIIETQQGLKRIQVRSTEKLQNGKASLSLRSITPGTRTQSCKTSRIENVDIFALYVVELDSIIFIDADEVKSVGTNVSFRFKDSKNNQKKGIRQAEPYFQPKFLQDEK